MSIQISIDGGDQLLYPNPAEDQVELVIRRSGTHEIDIWSMTGKRIHSMKTAAMVERIETGDWASGIYLVRKAITLR